MGTLARRLPLMMPLLIVPASIFVGLFIFIGATGQPCPLSIQFIGLTNYPTHDAAMTFGVFAVTNRGGIALKFRGITESKSSRGWPTYPAGIVPSIFASPDNGPWNLREHESCELRTLLPYDRTPVRISIACQEPWTRWESARWSVSVWFQDHNLPAVGRLISEGKRGHLIFSSEIHK